MNTLRYPTHKRRKGRSCGLPKERRPNRPGKTMQLIYAHLPPATVLAMEQHLRAQTQIQQRAQHLWLSGNNRVENTLENWLRAEREVVQNLCTALLRGRL